VRALLVSASLYYLPMLENEKREREGGGGEERGGEKRGGRQCRSERILPLMISLSAVESRGRFIEDEHAWIERKREKGGGREEGPPYRRTKREKTMCEPFLEYLLTRLHFAILPFTSTISSLVAWAVRTRWERRKRGGRGKEEREKKVAQLQSGKSVDIDEDRGPFSVLLKAITRLNDCALSDPLDKKRGRREKKKAP